jgi:Mg-chelatase subunit ChlD
MGNVTSKPGQLPPPELLCPISGELIIEPVIASDGRTYDRASLKEHIAKHKLVSPMNHSIPIEERTFPNAGMAYKLSAYRASVASTHLILVLDNSGSMGTSVTDGTGEQGPGITRMDLANHGAKTTVMACHEGTTVTIIKYSTTAAHVVHQVPVNTAADRNRIVASIDSIKPDGGTNMVNGLVLAHQSIMPGYTNHIMFLTDGEPTDPKDGIIAKGKEICRATSTTTTLSTFSFGSGSAIDSSLMLQLAQAGHGSYSYIPDISMVGTTFASWLAGISHAESAHSTISPILRAEYIKLLMALSRSSNGADTLIQAFIRDHLDTHAPCPFVDAIRSDLVSTNADDGQVLKAVSRQDWFSKWGMHYIMSLQRAHELGVCHNYKDKSVQVYGNDSFNTEREKIDGIFCTLVVVRTGSIPYQRTSYTHASSYTPAPTPVRTQAEVFYGGCVTGGAMVSCRDDSDTKTFSVRIDELPRYPDVRVEGGAYIKCVVSRKLPTGTPMIRFWDSDCKTVLQITPWHPVAPNDIADSTTTTTKGAFGKGAFGKGAFGTWAFPIDIEGGESYTLTEPTLVYTLVLTQDGPQSFTVGAKGTKGGYKCAPLGHGNVTDPVLSHPYFSSKVLADLEKMEGWNSGFISLTEAPKRDLETGLVSGI